MNCQNVTDKLELQRCVRNSSHTMPEVKLQKHATGRAIIKVFEHRTLMY